MAEQLQQQSERQKWHQQEMQRLRQQTQKQGLHLQQSNEQISQFAQLLQDWRKTISQRLVQAPSTAEVADLLKQLQQQSEQISQFAQLQQQPFGQIEQLAKQQKQLAERLEFLEPLLSEFSTWFERSSAPFRG